MRPSAAGGFEVGADEREVLRNILKFLELAQALFDDAAKTSGGPQRITQFIYAKDVGGPAGQAAKPTAKPPLSALVGEDGKPLVALDPGSLEAEG